jgi:hypothetical protein
MGRVWGGRPGRGRSAGKPVDGRLVEAGHSADRPVTRCARRRPSRNQTRAHRRPGHRRDRPRRGRHLRRRLGLRRAGNGPQPHRHRHGLHHGTGDRVHHGLGSATAGSSGVGSERHHPPHRRHVSNPPATRRVIATAGFGPACRGLPSSSDGRRQTACSLRRKSSVLSTSGSPAGRLGGIPIPPHRRSGRFSTVRACTA